MKFRKLSGCLLASLLVVLLAPQAVIADELPELEDLLEGIPVLDTSDESLKSLGFRVRVADLTADVQWRKGLPLSVYVTRGDELQAVALLADDQVLMLDPAKEVVRIAEKVVYKLHVVPCDDGKVCLNFGLAISGKDSSSQDKPSSDDKEELDTPLVVHFGLGVRKLIDGPVSARSDGKVLHYAFQAKDDAHAAVEFDAKDRSLKSFELTLPLDDASLCLLIDNVTINTDVNDVYRMPSAEQFREIVEVLNVKPNLNPSENASLSDKLHNSVDALAEMLSLTGDSLITQGGLSFPSIRNQERYADWDHHRRIDREIGQKLNELIQSVRLQSGMTEDAAIPQDEAANTYKAAGSEE